MPKKTCFMNSARPCDLTCKAAFEVDDPVDNVDCHFIWLAYHFGEAMFSMKSVMENFAASGGAGPTPPSNLQGGPGPGPKKPKSPPMN